MTANTNTTLKQLNPDIACLEKICTQLQAELTHSEKTLRTSGYLKKLAAGLATKESSCTLLPPDQVLLSTGKSNGVWQYYVSFSPKTGKRHYLPSSERQLAVNLAQRDYLHLAIGETERLLKRAELVWKQGGMLTWNSNLANTLAENINAKLPPARKALITPRILTDTEYTTLWMATSRAELTYRQDEKIHITDRGEKVRSKSEAKCISNILA